MNEILNALNPVRMLLDGSAGLVVLALHGFFLALASKALGDMGPQHDGRLTLNPMAHVDIFALVGSVLAQLGWVRPMDIRADDVKGGRLGIVGIVLIAVAATWALGRAAMAGRGLLISVTPPDMLQMAEAWLFTFTRMSERCALFNLIPILSLTAAHALRDRLPPALREPGPITSGLTLVLALAIKILVWR